MAGRARKGIYQDPSILSMPSIYFKKLEYTKVSNLGS
jgi:hypothetical protein